jgi:cytochrome c oxidase assembly protein subunit 11
MRMTILRHVALVFGMFAFAYAMVPMYGLICKLTGLGGKTSSMAYAYDPATMKPDLARSIRVNFITNTNDDMPWSFEALTPAVHVHPGLPTQVLFRVHNPTNRTIVGQAIPSLTPIRVVDQFHKTECFCFRQQTLEPGETLDMPMRFIIDPSIAKDVTAISLSYTLFDADKFAKPQATGNKNSVGVN